MQGRASIHGERASARRYTSFPLITKYPIAQEICMIFWRNVSLDQKDGFTWKRSSLQEKEGQIQTIITDWMCFQIVGCLILVCHSSYIKLVSGFSIFGQAWAVYSIKQWLMTKKLREGHWSIDFMRADSIGYWILTKVDGNGPLEDYFYHLNQNNINFLFAEVLFGWHRIIW